VAVRNDVHGRSLSTSSALSVYYVPELIPPRDVIRVLNDAGVRFMLLGAHGLAGWTRSPRATQDVDILVGVRSHKKAVRALLAAYPRLVVEDHEVVTRLQDLATGEAVIDVLRANQPLYREALKYTYQVNAVGQSYEIPSLELALTMKFASMISLNRPDEDKHVDASDFIKMVKANSHINQTKLHHLGELVYSGGGDELIEKVRQVRAGEKLKL
jgi:hypothetical protein